MKNKKTDKITKLLAAALKKNLGNHIKNVILFGSRARGDYYPQSDYDVIVLVDSKTKEIKNQIREIVLQIDWDYDVFISVFVYEKTRFDEDKYEPLFMNIRKEGVLVA